MIDRAVSAQVGLNVYGNKKVAYLDAPSSNSCDPYRIVFLHDKVLINKALQYFFRTHRIFS